MPDRGARTASLFALAALLLVAVGPAATQEPPIRVGPEAPPAAGRPAPADPRPAAIGPIRVLDHLGKAGDGPVPGYVVARFAPGVTAQQAAFVAGSLGASRLEPAIHAPFVRVEPGEETSQVELLRHLERHPDVLWAELDRTVHALVRDLARATQAATFDDPFFPFQWSFARIRFAETVPLNPGLGAGVVVAVLDTGVAFGDGAFFPAQRGLDLDGTQFVAGFDFIDPGTAPYDEGSASGNGLRFGHGTYVTSLIAATINNGIAGVGVAPSASIMPVRVLNVEGSGAMSTIAEAIGFAVANGARVINMSFGGSEGTQALRDAVQTAARAGAVLLAAAGNEAEEDDFDGEVAFPARYPEVIAVGATTFADGRASYSNTGNRLDIMAPGGQSPFNEVGGDRRDATLATSFLHDPVTGETDHAGFWATGTSFSAPQAAAAAALLVGLGVDEPRSVRTMLVGTARDLGERGWDTDFGHGLVDLLESHRGAGFSF